MYSSKNETESYEDLDLQDKVRAINECVTVWDSGSISVDEFCYVTFDQIAAIAELLKTEGRLCP